MPSQHGYIVVFRAGVDAAAESARLSATYGFAPRHVYTSALSGFAAELGDEVAARLGREPSVEYVERDGPVSID